MWFAWLRTVPCKSHERELKLTRPHDLSYPDVMKNNISEHWLATRSCTQSGTCNRVFGVVGRAWAFKCDRPGIESHSNATFWYALAFGQISKMDIWSKSAHLIEERHVTELVGLLISATVVPIHVICMVTYGTMQITWTGTKNKLDHIMSVTLTL